MMHNKVVVMPNVIVAARRDRRKLERAAECTAKYRSGSYKPRPNSGATNKPLIPHKMTNHAVKETDFVRVRRRGVNRLMILSVKADVP